MDKTIKQLKQLDIKAEGLVLVTRGKRFAIYDDQKSSRAVINYIKYTIIETGEGRKRAEEFKQILLPRPRKKLQWRLIEYACKSLIGNSNLLPFALENKSIMNLVEYLFRYKIRSERTLMNYVCTIKQFCDYAGKGPDEVIASCLDKEGIPSTRKVLQISKLVDEFLGEKEAEDLTSGSLLTLSARLKTLFDVNGVELSLPRRYSMRVKRATRAIRPEEIQLLMEIAPLREKALIMLLATSGLRISTAVQLKY